MSPTNLILRSFFWKMLVSFFISTSFPAGLFVSLIVQKYGGTSLATIAHIKTIAKHIAHTSQQGHKVIAVVSAMGHQTDELIDLAHQVSRHPSPRELDMLLSVGERISMSLMSIALNDLGVTSMSLTGSQSGILTDGCHGNARIQKVLGDRIREGLDKKDVVIVAGFQGMSVGTKEITTLGRGGTDLTAVAIAYTLKASGCQIYKDVDGICTADPNTVPEAKPLTQLHWKTLMELAWAGAPVVHARAAHLAWKFKIPLEIRSSFKLERQGTSIHGEIKVESVQLASLVHKKQQTLLTVNLPTQGAWLSQGVDWLWQRGESPLFCKQELTKGGVLRYSQLLSTKHVEGFLAHLNMLGANVKEEERFDDLTAISIVGDGFWQSPETVARIFNAMGEAPQFFDSRNSVITIGVKGNADAILQRLHQELFEA